ncbi:MAG: hypothetical protein K8Q99_01255 [Acholeplasmataceae bacterium]|nr:hypothetical protein [Acholeplasmataceae bacterium]
MIVDNDKFSNEQKQIITNIGKKNRDNKHKLFRKLKMTALFAAAFSSSLLLGVYMLDGLGISTLILLSIIGIVIGVLNYTKAKKTIVEVLSKSDYEIGLYYADKDKEIIGNGYKSFKQAKIGLIVISVMGLFMVIMMSIIFSLQNPVDYDSLTEITGRLKEARLDSDDNLNLILEDDITKYSISSIYTSELDIDRIFDEIGLRDNVVFLVNEAREVNNGIRRSVYYFEVESIVYMDYDLMMQGYQANHNIGVTMIIVFAILSIGSIGTLIVQKNIILVKKQSKEKYDLSIKVVDLENIDDTEIFEMMHKPKIDTFAPKGLLMVVAIIMIASILGIIFSLILIKDPTDKLIISIFLGIMAIVCAVGYYDGLKHNERIEGNYFIIYRFFKVKKIDIKDIKRVSSRGQFVTLSDINNETLARMSSMTGNLDKIIERLSEYGVIIEIN